MLFQTCQTVGKEAFAPQGDDLTAGVQSLGNLVVGHAFGSVEDHSGSLNLEIRQRIFCCASAQLHFLARREDDCIGA
jgi:hypothetical protein